MSTDKKPETFALRITKNPHSSMSISLDWGHDVKANNYVEASIGGCRECLSRVLACLMTNDPDFKAVISSAVKIANEAKAAKEN